MLWSWSVHLLRLRSGLEWACHPALRSSLTQARLRAGRARVAPGACALPRHHGGAAGGEPEQAALAQQHRRAPAGYHGSAHGCARAPPGTSRQAWLQVVRRMSCRAAACRCSKEPQRVITSCTWACQHACLFPKAQRHVASALCVCTRGLDAASSSCSFAWNSPITRALTHVEGWCAGEPMDDDHLIGEVATLFFAGFETTGNSRFRTIASTCA